MPSSATITSFVTMVAGTRARAAHVNTNFDVFRGHIVPVNTDTSTASDNTHDLGSTDHRWRRIYLGEAPVVNGVQGTPIDIPLLFDASIPTDLVEDAAWITKASFPTGRETGIAFQFIVPTTYTSGNRMGISFRAYCDTSPSHVALESAAALYKSSLTSVGLTAPTNVLTTTANVNPTLSGVLFTNSSLYLTDASGLINSVTVTAGDVIACYLKRKGAATGDTNTGYFHLTNLQILLSV